MTHASAKAVPDTITAVLLAGSRPGVDPLAAATGRSLKALVPVAGEAMLSRVARTLRDHPRIAAVHVLAQEPEALTADPDTAWLADDPKIRFEVSGMGISRSLQAVIAMDGVDLPLLVTTADNALLTGAMIDDFLTGAADVDVAVAMVERRVLLASYPQSQRTWLKFRSGWWSGANLFWLASPKVDGLLSLWADIEQDRKKGLKIVSAFGPLLLLGAVLRLLSLEQAMRLAGRRFGVRAKPVAMPQAEACIDVDKPSDLALVEQIMKARLAARP